MEEHISVLEKDVKQLEAQLADDSIYNQAEKLKQINDSYQLKKMELRENQVRWEALADQIMELEA
jgi:ATP-binding cassette subfamily F protein 3